MGFCKKVCLFFSFSRLHQVPGWKHLAACSRRGSVAPAETILLCGDRQTQHAHNTDCRHSHQRQAHRDSPPLQHSCHLSCPQGQKKKETRGIRSHETILLTNTSLAPIICLWKPSPSCKTSSPWRSYWADKDNTALVLKGETVWRDNAKHSLVCCRCFGLVLKTLQEINGLSALQLMDLKLHFVLLRGPISEAIRRVLLWAHFWSCSQHCVSLPAVPGCLCIWMLTFPTPKS